MDPDRKFPLAIAKACTAIVHQQGRKKVKTQEEKASICHQNLPKNLKKNLLIHLGYHKP